MIKVEILWVSTLKGKINIDIIVYWVLKLVILIAIWLITIVLNSLIMYIW